MWNRWVQKCKVTVKAYQEEIDNLTRIAVTESAYGSLQPALTDLPDPAEVMSVAEQQMKAQQAQMEQLLHGRIRNAQERRCIIKGIEKESVSKSIIIAK
jgi:hypothetical protein